MWEIYSDCNFFEKPFLWLSYCLLITRQDFVEVTPAIFRPLYVVIMRLLFPYAFQVVASYLQKDLRFVEHMQRLAIRCVKDLDGLQHPALR